MINRFSFFRIFTFVSSFLVCSLFSVQGWAEDSEETCKPLQEYVNEGSTFLLEGAFGIVKDVFNVVANGTWSIFSPAMQTVVVLGIAIYIAMYTLKNVGSFSNQDVSAYLTGGKGGVIPILLKGAFIVYLLGNQQIVYNWMISPIIEVGAAFGNSSVYKSSDVDSLFGNVIDQAKDFNGKAYKIVAMGRLLICSFSLPDGIFDWYWSIIPFGAVLFVFGWLIILGVSFYMLDITFRLGVGCTVLPLALACSLSKYTVNYTKQTWALFINVAFSFVMLNLIIQFAERMISESLVNVSGGDLESLLNKPITESTVAAVANQLTRSITSFVLMTFCCLIAFKLCMGADDVVKKISGTQAVGSDAQKIGGAALAKAQYAAMTPARHTLNLAGATLHEAGDTAMNSKPVNAVRRGYQSFRNAVKQKVFRLKD